MANNQKPIRPYQEGTGPIPNNRALQMRRDNDTVITPKITLYDIDYAVMYHLGQNMKLQVSEDDRRVDVPVVYTDGEKWAQIRSRGYLRDDKNKAITPLIAIRRTTVEPDTRLPILDLNNYVPYRKFFPFKQMNMQRDKLSGQILRKPSYEYYMVDVPNFVRVSYELTLWTSMIEQMNYLVQSLVAVSNHLWGDYYQFRAVVTNTSMNNTNNVGEDRVISTNVTLSVDGYLQEEYEYHEPTMRKAYTIKTVNFENEQEELDFYLDEPYSANDIRHVTQEPKHVQLMNKRRNLRYR